MKTLTKKLAKEAAIIMCNHAELKVLKVGRWRKDGQLLKRGFTTINSRGNSIIVEVTFTADENKVSLKDFFMDFEIGDFVPGRGEWDDEIELELKDKFGTDPTIVAGLEKPTNDQALKIGLRLIRNLGFKISYTDNWHGEVNFGSCVVKTNCGNVFIHLYSEGIITIVKRGKVLKTWTPIINDSIYSFGLQGQSTKALEELFDATNYCFMQNTCWIKGKNCMIAYLTILDGLKKINGKAILTEEGHITVYNGNTLLASLRCWEV